MSHVVLLLLQLYLCPPLLWAKARYETEPWEIFQETDITFESHGTWTDTRFGGHGPAVTGIEKYVKIRNTVYKKCST